MNARRAALACSAVLLLPLAALALVGHILSTPARHAPRPAPSGLALSPFQITSPDSRMAGWIARGTGSGVVLLLHGVRANHGDMLGRAAFLQRLGYTVVLIDLPGHGASAGERITFGAREADGVRAALDWIAASMPGQRVAVIGSSLGAAALVLSQPGRRIDALVLEAMYPTIDEAVGNRLAIHLGSPGRWLTPFMVQQIPLYTGVPVAALRPVDAMSKLTCPLLVMSGTLDRHTTVADTQRVFAAGRTQKQLWLIEGAAHVDLHAFATQEYERRVGEFLAAALRKPQA